MKKIILAGGAGYLGRAVSTHFLALGYDVVVLTRGVSREGAGKSVAFNQPRFVRWDGETLGDWRHELEGATLLMNLAGRTVNCRYTAKNRRDMMQSRVRSTEVLGEAVRACVVPPKVWMNSSTATIYRNALDVPQTESHGDIGKGFSVEIAKAWEAAFFGFARTGVRQVALRSAMVFGPGSDGVYAAFREITKQRLGGTAASGEQFVSWIHLEDFLGMIDWLLAHEDLSGAINLSSPDPRPNKEFMRAMRDSLGVSFGLPASEWMLEIGAFFKRTETELLLKSRRVIPQRLLESGYKMKFPNLDGALEQLARTF